jgi:RNA polymerase sigma factor (sigma-70 family)
MDVLDHGGASDTRLTVAASEGDDDAFAVLYARYAPRIEGYLQRLLGDEHLAQDLTQEVFVSALNRLRSARPPIAVGPWLYRIARNASIDVHRRSQLVRQVPLPGPEDDKGALTGRHEPQAQAELRQWLDDLRDLLGGLSDSHRAVLVLRELEGRSNAEIAEQLGVSRPAVEGLLFRARAKVRSEYEDLTSGRRCARVQAAVDRVGAGERLGERELQLACRHLGACAQCRRHAWEAGVTDLLERSSARRRRVLLPAPLMWLLSRLSSDQAPLLAAPWGRTAAAVTVVAVSGGAVAPHVHRTETATARPAPIVVRTATAGPTALAARPAPRSPAAVATVLPRPSAAVAPRVHRRAAAPSSPARATPPAGEPAAPRPGAAPQRAPARPAPARTPEVPPAPQGPVAVAVAARMREPAESLTEPVAQATPAPVAAPLHETAAAVDRAAETVAAAAETPLPAVTTPLLTDPVETLVTPVAVDAEVPATPVIPAIAPEVPAVG